MKLIRVTVMSMRSDRNVSIKRGKETVNVHKS